MHSQIYLISIFNECCLFIEEYITKIFLFMKAILRD